MYLFLDFNSIPLTYMSILILVPLSWLLYCTVGFEPGKYSLSDFACLVQYCLVIPGTLNFYMNFVISLLVSMKWASWILIRLTLYVYVSLGGITTVEIFSDPISESDLLLSPHFILFNSFDYGISVFPSHPRISGFLSVWHIIHNVNIIGSL